MPRVWGSTFGKEIDKNELAFTPSETLADTLLASAATDIAFTGLDLDSDGHYRIILNCIGAASNLAVGLYCNADFTTTNYNVKLITSEATTVSTAAQNNAIIGLDASANEDGMVVIDIVKSSSEKPRATSVGQRKNLGYIDYYVWEWGTTTNVTTLTLRNAGANGFAAGTRAIIYKVS